MRARSRPFAIWTNTVERQPDRIALTPLRLAKSRADSSDPARRSSIVRDQRESVDRERTTTRIARDTHNLQGIPTTPEFSGAQVFPMGRKFS